MYDVIKLSSKASERVDTKPALDIDLVYIFANANRQWKAAETANTNLLIQALNIEIEPNTCR